jgi:hypothetical protein
MKPTIRRTYNSSMRQAAFCEPPVKRPNYFSGQMLSADDFTAEQEYHRGKQRLHNLHCHGFGVVQGLKVSTVKENAGWTVVIEPGFAIDPAGNEIQLCTTMRFRLPASQTAIQVGIRFSERLCDSVPSVSDATSLGPQPSRVEEGCEVLLDPVPIPRGSRAKAGGLGTSLDVLPLARLVRTGRAWRVDRKFKAPRAH